MPFHPSRQLCDQPVEKFFAPGGQDQPAPPAGELSCKFGADAGRCAGDEDGFLSQFHVDVPEVK